MYIQQACIILSFFICILSTITSLRLPQLKTERTTISPIVQTQFISCPSCNEKYSSRNKLYQHFRSSEICSSATGFNYSLSSSTVKPKRQFAAILFGYNCTSDEAESIISDCLYKLEEKYIYSSLDSAISITRASSSVYRQSDQLRQGIYTKAAGDVIMYSFLSTSLRNISKEETVKWLAEANEILHPSVRLFARKNLDSNVHAEQHCTTRIYDYILPTRAVLPEGVFQWNDLRVEDKIKIQARLKQIMKRLTTPKPVNRGGYWFRRSKEQQDLRESGNHRWHNFCSGKISPMDAAAGRSIDKFKIIFDNMNQDVSRTIESSFGQNDFLLVRAQGDGFLNHQVPKMIGTVLAIYKGYLPDEYADFVLNGNNIIDVPCAPEEFLLLKQCRYSFHTHTRSLFSPDISAQDIEYTCMSDPLKDVDSSSAYSTELIRSICSSPRFSQSGCNAWLHDLQQKSIVIKHQMNNVLRRRFKYENNAVLIGRCSEAPGVYRKLLSLLREADKSGEWPDTSIPRSKVIMNADNFSGSFSIGNPVQGSVPRGNRLFQDLVSAIFELEGLIFPTRLPSSMVAVNRRASFRPHVDSGAGFGQTSSMIVGLGDYEGGELAVEGVEYDIRYKPLEFNGWKERHWTVPFRGERFTLVYFTPLVNSAY